jgi:hypothetical protein
MLNELCQHRCCRFAYGDDVDLGCTPEHVIDVRFTKGGSDEHRRIGRMHGCTQDVLQIASKIVNGTNQ